jgi:hypothetical protein
MSVRRVEMIWSLGAAFVLGFLMNFFMFRRIRTLQGLRDRARDHAASR